MLASQTSGRYKNFLILKIESRPIHDEQCMLSSSISILRPVAQSITYRGSAIESKEQHINIQKQTPIKGIKNFSATMGMNNGTPRNASNPRLSDSSSRIQRVNHFTGKRETFSSPHTSRRLKA